MGDIWLPGLPPAFTDYQHCLAFLLPLMPTRDSAVILAAIGGNESGYDYHVINDTSGTGDYSAGIFQINYFGDLYASRTAAYGTPRQLLESGVRGQCAAAADLWHTAGGFSPWAADIIGNLWQKWVGSGPVPANPSVSGRYEVAQAFKADARQLDAATRTIARASRALFEQVNVLAGKGRPGWRP